jgi:peroxiredoxin
VTLSVVVNDGPALIVFYPFAFSRICTDELGALRDGLAYFADAGVRVLAVSCDPTYSLRAYGAAEGFDFSLLSDFWPHGQVAQAYGVFDADLGMAGRGTFLVDSDGVVRWAVVTHPGQARDVADYRAAVRSL